MSRIGINIDGIEKTVKKLQSYGEEGDKQIRDILVMCYSGFICTIGKCY